MEKFRVITTGLLAAGLFCLAGSIFYFAGQLSQLHGQLPAVLQQVRETSQAVEPVVAEISRIRESLPAVIEEVEQVRLTSEKAVAEFEAYRQLAPDILTEVRLTRELVDELTPPEKERSKKPKASMPEILAEVKAVRKAVPGVLDESRAIRQALPGFLERVDVFSEAANNVSGEVKEVRPLVPGILEEVRETRESMPGILDKANNLALNARNLGEEAGEGAIGGMITGVLTSPFRLVGSVSGALADLILPDSIIGMTQTDKEMIEKAATAVLNQTRVGASEKWRNNSSGNSGEVKLASLSRENGVECKTLEYEGRFADDKVKSTVKLCRTWDGRWVAASPESE